MTTNQKQSRPNSTMKDNFSLAKEGYMIARVRNWATDCIRNQTPGNIVLNQIKITIDRFGQMPIPLTQEQRKRWPDCAKKEDAERAMPIHFNLQAGSIKLGNGALESCGNEYEGAQKVVDAFKWCLNEMDKTPPLDDLHLTTHEERQLSLDF